MTRTIKIDGFKVTLKTTETAGVLSAIVRKSGEAKRMTVVQPNYLIALGIHTSDGEMENAARMAIASF